MMVRDARLTVATTLVITMMTGCTDASAADSSRVPDWGAASGVSANCDDGFTTDYYLLGKHDVDNDGHEDWFVRLRCQKGDQHTGDQVEVFDGRPDYIDHPRRLGDGPLLHQRRNITFNGCVTFEGNTAYLADHREASGGWHVVRVATWQGTSMQVTKAPDLPVLCTHSAPAAPPKGK